MNEPQDAEYGGAMRDGAGWPGGDAFADGSDDADEVDAAQLGAAAGPLQEPGPAHAAAGMPAAACDAQLAQWIEAIAEHDERALAAL